MRLRSQSQGVYLPTFSERVSETMTSTKGSLQSVLHGKKNAETERRETVVGAMSEVPLVKKPADTRIESNEKTESVRSSLGDGSREEPTWRGARNFSTNSGFWSGTSSLASRKGVAEGRQKGGFLPRMRGIGRTGKGPMPVPEGIVKALQVAGEEAARSLSADSGNEDHAQGKHGSENSTDAESSSYIIADPSPIVLGEAEVSSGVDLSSDNNNNIRRRPAARRGDGGGPPPRTPSRDRDIELGESPPPHREQSRGRITTSSLFTGPSRGDPGDNSPSPEPESFTIPPRRSNPCLGTATLLCVILEVLSFVILTIAFKDSFIAEHSAYDSIHRCMVRCQTGSSPRMVNTIGDGALAVVLSPANDPQFYFSIQSSGWLTLGVISALIPAIKHAQAYQKRTRMCYVQIPGALSLLLGILSPWVFLKSQAVSNGLSGLAGAMQAMVIYYVTYEVFVEEKAEKIEIVAGRIQKRGRRRRDD